ncbi:MAG TPA: 50S ribosomal protein L21, partial [Candidatus Limnocylindria bacterium]
GGKQYRVEPGTTLTMERIGAEAGAPFTFDRVLLIGDGDQVTVGTPVVSGATVSATVLGEELGPKLVIFKFKQKVKYRRRTGHRQHLVRVRIDSINADGSAKPRSKAKATEAEEPGEKAEKVQKAEKPTAAAKPRASRAKASGSGKADDKPKAARKTRTTKAKAEKADKAEE